MKKKRSPGVAGTNNRARFTSLRIILADKSFRDKLRSAILYGSAFGAVLAMLGGILYMETSLFKGAVISVAGMLWFGAIYLQNAEAWPFGG